VAGNRRSRYVSPPEREDQNKLEVFLGVEVSKVACLLETVIAGAPGIALKRYMLFYRIIRVEVA
jgi:hypothetical protein